MLAEISYSLEENALRILEELNEFRKTEEHCDFVIKVGSEEIHVHRNIICANSKYFKAMLTHDTKEKQTGCVELKDMDKECVEICADFMYCQKLIIEEEKREEILCVADFLQLREFCDSIAQYYEENLDENSFYATKKLAATYHCSDLEDECDLFAMKNFEAIAQLSEFKDLTQEYIAYLLKSDENDTSETNKVKALLNWVRHDDASRGNFLPVMLEKLCLAEVSARYKQFLLHGDLLISESLNCVKLLCGSLLCNVSANPSYDVPQPSKTDAIILFDDNSRHLQRFSLEDGTLTQMHKFREDFQLNLFSAISLKEFIYVLKGNRDVYRLDYGNEEASWEQIPSMLEEHGQWPPATADQNYVYVAGYWSGSNPSRCIERFDPTLNAWTKLTDNDIKKKSTPVVLHDCIYCIGGEEDEKCSQSVQIFDVCGKEWSTAAPLLQARRYCTATTYYGKIYVLGGLSRASIFTAECYDSASNSWSRLRSVLRPRQASQAVQVASCIYVVGGYNAYPSSIEKYNVEEDEWSLVEMPEEMDLKVLWSAGVAWNQ